MLHLALATVLLLGAAAVPTRAAGQTPEVYEAILQAVQHQTPAKTLLLDPRVLDWWMPDGQPNAGPWQIRFAEQHPSEWMESLREGSTIHGTCQAAYTIHEEPTCELTQEQVVVALSNSQEINESTVEVSVLLSGMAPPRPTGRDNPWARQEVFRLEKQQGKWVVMSRRTVVQT